MSAANEVNISSIRVKGLSNFDTCLLSSGANATVRHDPHMMTVVMRDGGAHRTLSDWSKFYANHRVTSLIDRSHQKHPFLWTPPNADSRL